jgi:ferredoxin
VFDVDEVTGKASVLLARVPPELESRVLLAESECPELAVLVNR